jgi:hypothetical protein
LAASLKKDVDGRVEPGHDENDLFSRHWARPRMLAVMLVRSDAVVKPE